MYVKSKLHSLHSLHSFFHYKMYILFLYIYRDIENKKCSVLSVVALVLYIVL